jgi:Fic family protein
MDIAGLVPADRNVEGVVEMMLDATQHYKRKLSQDRLFGWHAALFPTGHSGTHRIVVAGWRDNTPADPMQVVSGPMGKEKVHFEAPAAALLPGEMKQFLEWFNKQDSTDPILKAAIAHLWFVTIHPFDDGNGRIARAIADMQLARADQSAQRFYSMSLQIRNERKGYYDILEKTQKGDLNITEWIIWFLRCLDKALSNSNSTLAITLKKASFWQQPQTAHLNERQRLMLNKLFSGFEGNLNSSKWATIAKCSQDTANRDINQLLELGILVKSGAGGRSTSYLLQEAFRTIP